MEKICVAVRVRPLVSDDDFNGTFWKIEDNRVSLHRPHGTPVPGVSYAFGTLLDLKRCRKFLNQFWIVLTAIEFQLTLYWLEMCRSCVRRKLLKCHHLRAPHEGSHRRSCGGFQWYVKGYIRTSELKSNSQNNLFCSFRFLIRRISLFKAQAAI